jgi:hypothetical protein
VFGLPNNIGEWLQAMRELHRRQTEATERLAIAAERMANALEGRTGYGKAGEAGDERAAVELVAQANGKRRRG